VVKLLIRHYYVDTIHNAASKNCNIGTIRRHASESVSPTHSEISSSTNGLVHATIITTFQGISMPDLHDNFDSIYTKLLFKGLSIVRM
jgi:hypothetical protein